MVVAGPAFGMKGGGHVRYPEPKPLANLQPTLLDRPGVRVDECGDSPGKLNRRSEI